MASFEFNNLAVHYEDTGRGHPVVLLHSGGASSSRQWRKLGAAFPENYRIVAPDLINCGGTDCWTGPDELTHDHQAEMVAALIAECGLGPVHLVGHSYGGSCAVRMALGHAALVRSLVLVEPNVVNLLRDAGEDDIYQEYRKVADHFVTHVAAGDNEVAWRSFIDVRNGAGAWDAMSAGVQAKLIAQSQQTVDGFAANLSNRTTIADCSTISVPTLVIRGGDTTRPERRITELLAETIPGCRFDIIPGAEHMCPITHPEAVASSMLRHFDEVDGAR